jgi:hypothetical protein
MQFDPGMNQKIVWEVIADDNLVFADQVIGFLKQEFQPVLADDIWFDGYFQWKLGNQNPAGKGYLSIGMAAGKVIAAVSLAKKRVLLNGNEYTAAEFGDAYCSNDFFANIEHYEPKELDQDHPSPSHYFNKSIFGKAASATTRRALQDGIGILYGVPNQNAYPGWVKRLNHFALQDHPIHALVRPSSRYLASRYKYIRPFSSLLHYIDVTASYLLRSFSRATASKKLTIKETIPDFSELDGLWNQVKPTNGFSLIRDSLYWNYRYFTYPADKYRTYTIQSSGKTCGIIITCIQKIAENTYRCCLVEWMLAPGISLQQILSEIIFCLRNEPIDHFVSYCNLESDDAKSFRKNLFKINAAIRITFCATGLVNAESFREKPFVFYMGNTDAI